MPDDKMPSKRERELIDAARGAAAELLEVRQRAMPPGDAIPGFQIVEELGRGGMGVVYKARQVSTKRVVALKIMLGGSFASLSAQRRFQREVELAARFQHPGIVRVLESGRTPTGQQYYAMDYVKGLPLDRWLSTTQSDVHATLRLLVKICEAVEYAHAHDVIHRDLKPGNVLVDSQGEPHVLDFGLAKATDHPDIKETLTLSRPGQILGTPRYVAPEQAAGPPAKTDCRTDVYALGTMLYEMITGEPPFDRAGSPSAVIQSILEDAPAPPSSLTKHVSRELEDVILMALEKEKPRRYQSVTELREDINRCLNGDPVLAQRPSGFYRLRKRIVKHRQPIAVGTLALVLGLVGLWGGSWWRHRAQSEERARAVYEDRRSILNIQRRLEAGPCAECTGEAHAYAEQYPEALVTATAARFRDATLNGDVDARYDAFAGLRRLFEQYPSRWHCGGLLAELYRAMGDHDQADRMQIRADEQRPDTAEAWYLRSFTTLSRDKALRYTKETVKRNPSHSLAWERLAYLYLQNSDLEAALEATQRWTELRYSHHEPWILGGHILVKTGRFAEAEERFTQGVILAPDSRRHVPLRRRAQARLCQEKYAEAVRDYSLAIEASKAAVWIYYQRATAQWVSGRPEDAAADYRKFFDLNGSSSYAAARLFLVRHEQARELEQADRHAEARQARDEANRTLEAARGRAPSGSWEAKILECLAGERTPQELVDAAGSGRLKRACEACYYAGEVYLLDGDPDEARHWLRQCVDTDLPLEPGTSPPDPMNEYHLAKWRLKQLSGDSADLSRNKE